MYEHTRSTHLTYALSLVRPLLMLLRRPCRESTSVLTFSERATQSDRLERAKKIVWAARAHATP